MSEVIKSIDLRGGKTLEIYHDPDPESPREWEANLGTMAIFHTKYTNLGDKDIPFTAEQFNGWNEMKAYIMEKLEAPVILPVYMYDHSGITISTQPFGDGWDSGQIGFIYTTVEKLTECDMHYRKQDNWSKFIEDISIYLTDEVETYNMYLTGEIYGFALINEHGHEEDSCWGFYGDDYKTNGMMRYIDPDDILEPEIA